VRGGLRVKWACIGVVRPFILSPSKDEARLCRAPQDEEVCDSQYSGFFILRCGAKRSLEGRTTPMQFYSITIRGAARLAVPPSSAPHTLRAIAR
jgi:hypothetical protein